MPIPCNPILAGREGAYTIPSTVHDKEIDQIWTSGFEGAASLTDITIPASIGRLGTAAFENTGLTHVTIPDTVHQVDPRPSFRTALPWCL